MGKDYDTEKIWQRVNSSVDLRKLKKAKTDKERFEIFEKALAKDPRTKNLLKPRAFLRKNLRKIYNRVLAKELSQGEKGVQKSLKRFSEPRRKEILQFSREQKIYTLKDELTKKGIIIIKVKGLKRETVAKGKLVTVLGKVYKGGQFLPNPKQ